MDFSKRKTELLKAFSRRLVEAIKASAPDIPRIEAEGIPGPRSASIILYAGTANGKLLTLLSAHQCAFPRSLVPWPFNSIQVYMQGPGVKVEVPWPPELQETYYPLTSLLHLKPAGVAWIWGVSETGKIVCATLKDHSPHWLVAGTTGSGKTTALLAAIYQLCQTPNVRLVLLDGKGGVSFEPLKKIPNLLGPVVSDLYSAYNALSYVVAELRRRYKLLSQGIIKGWPAIVVIVDEFQEFTSAPSISRLLREIAASGRAAHIHLILSSQHPNIKMFGDWGAEIKRNLPGRLVLRVLDADASRVAVGGPYPRADLLLGLGDAYIITSTALRIQVPFVSIEDFKALGESEPELRDWPEAGSPFDSTEAMEIAAAIRAVLRGKGRPWATKEIAKLGLNPPGAEKGIRLMQMARDILEELKKQGYTIASEGGNGHGGA